MSNGKSKSLNSGGFTPAGSIVNIAIVVLVVIVLVLCAGVFVLYNHDKGSSDDAKAAKDSYNVLNASYDDLSGKYTALVANDADLNERFNELNTKYDNVSGNYDSLKNQSDTTTVKLGEFLENDPTVAYNYNVTANSSADNVTSMVLTVDVYNVAKVDINNVVVTVNIVSIIDNSTGQLTKTIPMMPALSKTQVVFDNLDNTTRVQSVWVKIA